MEEDNRINTSPKQSSSLLYFPEQFVLPEAHLEREDIFWDCIQTDKGFKNAEFLKATVNFSACMNGPKGDPTHDQCLLQSNAA